MKTKLYSVVITVFIIMIVTSCNQLDVDNNNPNIDKIDYEDIYEGKTIGEKSIIFEGPLLIDNVPILSMTYGDILEHFGEPKETRNEKLILPATEDYQNITVLCYEGIEILFYPSILDNPEAISTNQTVWNFDLTSDKYNIGKLRVGMTIEEYQEIFENSKIYSMADVIDAHFNSNTYTGLDAQNYSYLERLIIMPRPENYYLEYNYVSYEQGISVVSPVGLALLIKDDKIDRIVYGFPNAS